MIVLIDQVSNLDEHLYLLLGIPKLQKLGQERLRLPIQKPYQFNTKLAVTRENHGCVLLCKIDYVYCRLAFSEYKQMNKGGFVFGSEGLSVCLFGNNITHKVMNGF